MLRAADDNNDDHHYVNHHYHDYQSQPNYNYSYHPRAILWSHMGRGHEHKNDQHNGPHCEDQNQHLCHPAKDDNYHDHNYHQHHLH